MKADIISIGTELLLGHIVNTNTAYLSQRLAELGIDVFYHTTVGDNPDRLTQTLKQALGRSDIVITSGGLGPTVDDITVKTLRPFFSEKIKWIRNNVGTAPGLIIPLNYPTIQQSNHKTIICLPGPPRELEPMFEHDIASYIRRAHLSVPYGHRGSWTIISRTIKTTGLAESRINAMVKDLLNLKPPTTVGIYAKLKEVDLKIMAKAGTEAEAQRAINKIENKIRARMEGYIFGCDDERLEDTAANILFKKKKTIAVAESCTGGLVSNRLTNVSGSSKYFIMGLVAYSNLVKTARLGVNEKTLKKYGAVSRQVALEMAKGIRELAGSDIGIGITGIAGPAGGTRSKPVGLVYIALVTDRKKIAKEFRFKGSREEIKFQSSQAALDLLRRNIV